jgi:hypothetical protein
MYTQHSGLIRLLFILFKERFRITGGRKCEEQKRKMQGNNGRKRRGKEGDGEEVGRAG